MNTSALRFALTWMALFVGMTTGCSDKSFTFKQAAGSAANPNGLGDDEATGRVPQDCENDLQQLTIPIKLLFIVDTSGSNASDPGTDVNKVVRGQSIQEFFNLYKNKTNFSWAMNIFSGSTSSPLISGFTTNSSTMQQAINNFFNVTDTGQTPYMAALNLGQQFLTNDSNRTAQTKWVVVFLSDGMPNPAVDQSTLNSKVAQIVGQIPGQVSFNTVYYGPNSTTEGIAAASRLQSMAAAGGGKFLNTNQAQRTFPITDVITVPGTSCR